MDNDKENKVYSSSGNIFADLGLPLPEERMLKAELTRKISETITTKKLTQIQAAEILEIDHLSLNSTYVHNLYYRKGCIAQN